MKANTLFKIFVLPGLLLTLMPGCTKDAINESDKENNILVPTVKSTSISGITSSSASAGGEIVSDGGAPVTARGVCWSTLSNPSVACSKTMDGNGTGSFTTSIAGLSVYTTYYLRAYATNSAGTGYGNTVDFRTIFPEAVTDIDGNVYHAINIGGKLWMVENLNTTRYRNGDPIPNVTVNADWIALTAGAYCWYNNFSPNKSDYGALYNWYAATDSRKLAPAGWHVATSGEWAALISYAGGEYAAYDYLIKSGFTTCPGGYLGGWRDNVAGNTQGLGTDSYLWSTTDPVLMKKDTWIDWLEMKFSMVSISSLFDINKAAGCSVRCVKD